MTLGIAITGQKMGTPGEMSPSKASRETPCWGTVLQGSLQPWGSWSTVSCHAEPSSSWLNSSLCSLSSELSPAVVLQTAPPWLPPAARGQQGPGSCQLALPWPCSVAWSTWAPCVLPVIGTCCPRLLHLPSWGWEWAGDPSVAFGGCTWRLCAAILSWDRGLCCSAHPKPPPVPQCSSTWLGPASCVSQPPGTAPTPKNLRSSPARAGL